MLTLQYIPFSEIEDLSSDKRVSKLLSVVKKNKIILMQGRLKTHEETHLIERTMEEVSKDFKGIELCTIYPNSNKKKSKTVGSHVKSFFAKMLVGNRDGFTIIGPANVVKEIKRNPDKIELFTHNRRRKGGK
jgi:hypothetical protein